MIARVLARARVCRTGVGGDAFDEVRECFLVVVALEKVVSDADEKADLELSLGSAAERLLEAVVVAFLVEECRDGVEDGRVADEERKALSAVAEANAAPSLSRIASRASR
jgi:hypothetical protein